MSSTSPSAFKDVEGCGCVLAFAILAATFVAAIGLGCIAFLRWLWSIAFA